MIKAEIDMTAEKATIQANGSILEILNDTAILINGIFKQLKVADPALSNAFQYALTAMVNDPVSPIWGDMGDLLGITIRKD